jgi:hypothetical protein
MAKRPNRLQNVNTAGARWSGKCGLGWRYVHREIIALSDTSGIWKDLLQQDGVQEDYLHLKIAVQQIYRISKPQVL